jgi:predicted transcriptional regulator
MKQNKVTSLVILDDQSRPVGVVRIHEITAAGL